MHTELRFAGREEPGGLRRGREGWSQVQADAMVQDGSHDGKPALPRAPHPAKASRKAQNLLGGNLALTPGRVLILLFNLHPCLLLDSLPERLPTLGTSGHAREGTVPMGCVPRHQRGAEWGGHHQHPAAKLGTACPHSGSPINLRRNKAINRGTRG